MVPASNSLDLSGERFTAVYHLLGDAEDAAARAAGICLEQTVELPVDLIRCPDIEEQIMGRVTGLEPLEDGRHAATIEFPVEIAGAELPQLLNVLYGNVSLLPGIRLMRFELPPVLADHFPGPRFGRVGLRELIGVPERPLLATAIKPLGLAPLELARLAGDLARGGMDLIKDDHGLADQPFSRFEERIARCAAAVGEANAQTGKTCLYLPNVTAPSDQLHSRAGFAREAGAGGLVISPGLAGLDGMRRLAADDELGMPIMCHPALLGSFIVGADAGIAPGALFGQIARLAGADATIFPSFGGRFSISETACRDLIEGTVRAMGSIAPAFPVPAGGMSLERVPGLIEFYGRDVILLIGGDLHRHGDSVEDGCRRFVELVEAS
ncbi:MAG: ribulose 1,5-bisphosphate carboxylase large subunit [Deltaproteobacteria bacterium]|nr:ribulose 1,5-bisphosphate carboxylase large subunit [Deltaproteobacteria bacterium]